ncbi:MAG TPA: YciI family protein [Polyangia bacterium]|nr:YciI family protein [Polyangia bacterium]
MRFMIMHKTTAAMETGTPPPKELIQGVGQLIGEARRQNALLGGAGLRPTSTRLHLAYRDGKRTVTPGPFAEPRELVAGFAQMKVATREEALGWCDRFAAVVGDVELYLGPVVEGWDLGVMPRPENPPLRFLSLHAEPRAGDDPQRAARLSALAEEMTRAGVLEAAGALAGTGKGARVRFDAGKPRVIDGPFAESKELVAGYTLLELPSKAVAIEWAIRLAAIIDVDEVEIREMAA